MMPLRRSNVLGYVNGFGGTVTQGAGKSTAVTLDKLCGQITMDNAALAAGAEVGFTVNNALVAAADIPHAVIATPGTDNAYQLSVQAVADGSFRLLLENVSALSHSDAVVINFTVIKGATQ